MKTYVDNLSTLPLNILYNVLEYNNPYKERFTKYIIKSNILWVKAWQRFYNNLENSYEKFVMTYILKYYNVIPRNPYEHISSDFILRDWKKYYPDDISFETERSGLFTFVTIYIESTVDGGGYCGMLGSSIIIFHCIILKHNDPLFNSVNRHIYNYVNVFYDNNYKLYRYLGYGRPSNYKTL